jgi:hypothetical protein
MTHSYEGQGDLPPISYYDDLMPAALLDRNETSKYIPEIEVLAAEILDTVLVSDDAYPNPFHIDFLEASDEAVYNTIITKRDEYGRATYRFLLETIGGEKIITIEEIVFREMSNLDPDLDMYSHIHESYNIKIDANRQHKNEPGVHMHTIGLVGVEELVSDSDYVPLQIESSSAFDNKGRCWRDSRNDYYKVTESDYHSMIDMLQRFLK